MASVLGQCMTYCNDCTSSEVILENVNILAVDKLLT